MREVKQVTCLVVLLVLATLLPMPEVVASSTVVTNVIPPTLVIGISVRDPETLNERYFLTRTQEGFAAMPFLESIALERDCILVVTVGGSAGSAELKELTPRIDLQPIPKERRIDPPKAEADSEQWLRYQVGYFRYHGNGTCAENQFAAFATNKAPLVMVIDATRLMIGPHTVDAMAKQEGRNSMNAVAIAAFRLVESNVQMEIPNPALTIPQPEPTAAVQQNLEATDNSAKNTGWTKVHRDAFQSKSPAVTQPPVVTTPPVASTSARTEAPRPPRVAQTVSQPAPQPVPQTVAVAQTCDADFELSEDVEFLSRLAREAENLGDWSTTAIYKRTNSPREVYVVVLRDGQPVRVREFKAELTKPNGHVYDYMGKWPELRPYLMMKPLPIEDGEGEMGFDPGDKITITWEGVKYTQTVPQERYNLWWVIDTADRQAPTRQITPSAVALSRLQYYRGVAAKQGRVLCVVGILNQAGDPVARDLTVVFKDRNGVVRPTFPSSNGFSSMMGLLGDEEIRVFVDGREVTQDIYGKPLPAMTVPGQETLIFVRSQ